MSTRHSATAILLACSAAFFWSQSWRALVYSALPEISLELGLSAGTASLIIGAMYSANMAGVLLGGFLPWGSRPVVLGALAVTVAAQWGMARAGSLGSLISLAALGGIGNGLYFNRGTNTITLQFAGAVGRAISVHELIGTAGLTLGAVFLGGTLPLLGWRWAAVAWSAVGLLASLLFWRHVPERWQGGGSRSAAALPLDARAPALILLGGCLFGLVVGLAAALPQLLVVGWGIAPAAAASFSGYTRVGAMAGIIIGGALGNWATRLRVQAAVFALCGLCVAGMALTGYGFWFGFLLITMTVTASACTPAYFAQIAFSYRPDEQERIFGIISAPAGILATVITPVAIGYLLEHTSAAAALGSLLALPLGGLIAIGWLAAFRRRSWSATATAPVPGVRAAQDRRL